MNNRRLIFLVLGLSGFSSIAMAESADLSRGHVLLLEHGLQLEASVSPSATGIFDPVRWAESYFTTAHFITGGTYPDPLPTGLGDVPGIPWSRIQTHPHTAPIFAHEVPYAPSLVRSQVQDEQDITDQAILDGIKTAFDQFHLEYPDVMVNTSHGPSVSAAAMRNYMQFTEPDSLMSHRYDLSGHGGSPTNFYDALGRYRRLSLDGNDGTGTEPIPFGFYLTTFHFDTDPGPYISESKIRLQNFASWTFGAKFANSYVYEKTEPGGTIDSVLFDGLGTTSPTPQFYYTAETNRQSRNLGPALVRLISTDLRMELGRHEDCFFITCFGPAENELPIRAWDWDPSADPYITEISATNLGGNNDGLEGDVIVGYFESIDESFSDPGFEDDTYFMILNGLSDASGTAAETAQTINLNFDFRSSGINSLLRLSRDTGLIEVVPLVSDGGSQYHLDLTLDGGTGDLFKFNNGATFLGATVGNANFASLIISPPPPTPPVRTWNLNSNGDWLTGGNWDPGESPNANTHTAQFGSVIMSPRTVRIWSSSVTVKAITFDNINSYTISGTSGSVNLEADAGNATIDVLQGSHQFQSIVNLLSNTDVDVAASSSLAFNNTLNLNGNTLTKTGDGTMDINGALNTGGGSVVINAGALGGSGEIGGDLVIAAGSAVAPGNSAGTLSVTGNYTQEAGAFLKIQIGGLTAGTQHDVLNVTGALTIDGGSLDISLINGFTPTPGDMFDVLNFGSAIGNLDAIHGTPGTNMAWDSSQLFVDGSLTAVSAVLGDMDGDLAVTTADAALFVQALVDRASYDVNGFFVDADFNGDVDLSGTFDLTDLSALSALLSDQASSLAVPEPGTMTLLGIMMGVVVLRRTRWLRARCTLSFTIVATMSLAICSRPASASPPHRFAGNGHFYEHFEGAEANYFTHVARASNQFYEGVQGHLFTSNTEAEWDFVENLLGDAGSDITMWIGLEDPGGVEDFEWITGESFVEGVDFDNWCGNCPRDNSGYNAVYIEEVGGPGIVDWQWTNQSQAVLTKGGGHYVVEYEVLYGDMNADDAVTQDDVSFFLLGLTDPKAYVELFEFRPNLRGDIDENGVFDFRDLNAFSALLGGPASASSVPEPNAITLIGFALSALGLKRRRTS